MEKFTKNKSGRYGRQNLCKKCHSKNNLVFYRKNPLKSVYLRMIQRCYNKNRSGYERYGGRGITVCDEWRNDRQSFIDWARANGFKPELSIDRRNNDGPYSPENCQWSTRSQQALNRRDTVTFLEKGTRICSKCKIEKPFSEFYPDRTHLSYYGHRFTCKVCDKKDYEERRERGKLGKKP